MEALENHEPGSYEPIYDKYSRGWFAIKSRWIYEKIY